MAAARWLLPWIKTQVRISSRSATGYTFPYLRSLEISFEYSGFWGPVAHFWTSEWLTRMIAFTASTSITFFISPESWMLSMRQWRHFHSSSVNRRNLLAEPSRPVCCSHLDRPKQGTVLLLKPQTRTSCMNDDLIGTRLGLLPIQDISQFSLE